MKRPSSGSFIKIWTAFASDIDPADVDLLALYVARFGKLLSGRRIFWKLTYVTLPESVAPYLHTRGFQANSLDFYSDIA